MVVVRFEYANGATEFGVFDSGRHDVVLNEFNGVRRNSLKTDFSEGR